MAQEIDTLSEELGHAGGDLGYTTEQIACRSKRIEEQERAIRNRAFAGGHNTMTVTELPLSTLETGSDSDRLGSGDEQQSSASSKRAQSKSSYQQRILPMFRLTVTHSQPLNMVATRLDTKQLTEAEIQRATQEAARGQAPESQRNEQGGKARFHSNFGAHRPEHKWVRRMEEPADCVKRVDA
eukprot:scaffold15279_cov37-Attheya_sp.AAC.4